MPSAFALLVFLARSFRVFFARLPKKLMDYLGPPSRPPQEPGDKNSSASVCCFFPAGDDDVATVAFVGRRDLLINYVRTETASLRGVSIKWLIGSDNFDSAAQDHLSSALFEASQR